LNNFGLTRAVRLYATRGFPVKKLQLMLTVITAIVIAAGIAIGAMKLSDNASPALLHLAQDHRLLLQAFILLLMLATVSLLLGGKHRGR